MNHGDHQTKVNFFTLFHYTLEISVQKENSVRLITSWNREHYAIFFKVLHEVCGRSSWWG